jgi:hypothetical protein
LTPEDNVQNPRGRFLRPRARILRTLGDELISSEIVAVIELVKNAYDADAKKVIVAFSNPTEETPKIEIVDNGNGMSLDVIQNSWMEPATLSKKRNPRSEIEKRRVLGEKGIGRFATSRLADNLEVVTRRRNTKTEIQVLFDWSQFDDEDKYLDEIEAVLIERQPTEIKPEGSLQTLWHEMGSDSQDYLSHGTALRMTQLRNQWIRESFDRLRDGLSRLISPFSQEDFRIFLKAPATFDDISGFIEPPELLNNPHYFIRGHVSKDGNYSLRIKLKNKNDEQEIDGKFQVSAKGSKDFVEPRCGKFNVEIRAWDREEKDLKSFEGIYGSTIDDIRADLNKASGVSIYRDGFRVLPYGEQDNDWLEQNLRRVQNPTLRFSNNQIVGYVLISADNNKNLRDQSNREGLVNNEAFDDLKELVKQVISELETRRRKLRKEEKQKESGKEESGDSSRRAKSNGLFTGFSLNDVRETIKNKHPEDKDLIDYVDTKQKEIEEDVKKVQEVISRYNRLATLGQLINVVLHDGRAPVASIVNECDSGLMKLKKAKKNDPDNILYAHLEENLLSIKTAAGVLSTVFRRIEPFSGRKRGRPSKIQLEQVIADAVLIFETQSSELGVKINLPSSITSVTVDRAEIQQVIVNLLQNSLYWLSHVPKQEREIDIQVLRQEEEIVVIQFSDSGPGVEAEFRDEIFDPYFSKKPDGVGLGLAISGEIISRYYNGTLELLDHGPLDGATFRIILRKRVKL